MQEFIRFVAGSFNIAQRGTHVGLVTYANTAKLDIAFNTLKGAGYTRLGFERLVDGVAQIGGQGRRIDLGLQIALQQLFSQQSGARADARKVCQ